jgi:hypothetical protein
VADPLGDLGPVACQEPFDMAKHGVPPPFAAIGFGDAKPLSKTEPTVGHTKTTDAAESPSMSVPAVASPEIDGGTEAELPTDTESSKVLERWAKEKEKNPSLSAQKFASDVAWEFDKRASWVRRKLAKALNPAEK